MALVIVAPLVGVIVALIVVAVVFGTVGVVEMDAIFGAGIAPVLVRTMSNAAPTLLSLLAM